jgi:TolA-binding protein
LANSQSEMKDIRGARKTLEDLQKQYPNTDAAAAAKQRLATLR